MKKIAMGSALAEATWSDAFRRVRNHIAFVAAAICTAAAPLLSFAEAKQATLKAAGYTSSTTLTNFQALVKLSDNDAYGFSYTDCVASDGSDLWFEDANGNLIPHDIDTWNANGDSYVWVKIPSLSRDTQIVMHWGAARTQAQTCTPTNTWSGYVGVWHMNANGTTAEPDKTGHGLNAAPLNTSSSGVSFNAEAGIVGSGRANSDATDGRYFSVGSNDNPYHSTITTKANFSVSGWWKLSSTPNGNGYQRLICGMSSGSLHSWDVWRENGSYIGVRSGDGSNNSSSTGYGVAIAAGDTWHYLTVVWEGTTAKVYKNGSLVNTQTLRSNTHPNNVFTIGGRVGTGTRSFIGTFDEVRMYNGALSVERIAADYATMNDPTTFLVPASQPTATWTGAAGDGNPATAANWDYYDGSETPIAKVPDGETVVTIAGNSVNLQIPASSTFACKSFEIGTCTFTTNCDWRGLSVKPTITGTADLNGHNLHLPNLAVAVGGVFTNGVAATTNEVRFTAADTTYSSFGEETFVDNAANLKTAENARIVLVKGTSDISANVLKIGDASGIYADFVQTDGAVTMGNSAESRIGGWSSGNKGHGTYTMYGGSLTVGSSLHVGGYGTGEFTQHGGTVTLNSYFGVGRFSGSKGTYVITNGTLTVKNETEIGMDGGTGRFDICGDARVDLKSLVMPLNRGMANLRIADNASLTMTGLTIGRGYGTSDTKGYFTQDGGTVEIGGDATIGRTGIGHYTMTGGRLHATGYFHVGDSSGGNYSGDGLFSVSGDAVAELDKGIILGNSRTPGTLALSGGTLFTPSIKKGSNTATVTFDGGTVVATNVTDGGANFITELNNVTYGPSGLTLDTAGYNVTMATASGANVLASAGSTFTKTGDGTLTVAAVPPVENMVVSNGTLALSNSCDNASMLAHRWSFTGDLTDSVSGTAGVTNGSGIATFEGGVVKLPGGTKGTCYIDLGANKLSSDSVTIEAWFTLRNQVNWTRVFVIGGSSGHATVFNSRRSDNGNACNFDSLGGTQVVNTSGKVLATNTLYYVAVTFTPDGNGGVIEKQYVKKVGESGFIWTNTVTKANWSVTANAAQGYFWLGHSNGNDPDTKIDFDEVRVWNVALDETTIALSVEKGVDATAAEIAAIMAATSAASPALRTLRLESGATLGIGAGNTLVQPVVTGGGTVSGGMLKVANELLVTDLDDCLIVDGGTLDIDGAKVVLSATALQALAATGRTYTLVSAVNGGTITGSPLQPTGLPPGWRVKTTSSSVILRKDGMSIHIR